MANSIIAAVLSFFIPGLGQALSGEILKGIVFFIIAIVLGAIVMLVFKNWMASIINLIYSLYVAYDAYRMN